MRQLVRQAQITLDDQVQLVELLRLQRVPAGRAARAAVCLVVREQEGLLDEAVQMGQVLGVRELLQVSARGAGCASSLEVTRWDLLAVGSVMARAGRLRWVCGDEGGWMGVAGRGRVGAGTLRTSMLGGEGRLSTQRPALMPRALRHGAAFRPTRL